MKKRKGIVEKNKDDFGIEYIKYSKKTWRTIPWV